MPRDLDQVGLPRIVRLVHFEALVWANRHGIATGRGQLTRMQAEGSGGR